MSHVLFIIILLCFSSLVQAMDTDLIPPVKPVKARGKLIMRKADLGFGSIFSYTTRWQEKRILPTPEIKLVQRTYADRARDSHVIMIRDENIANFHVQGNWKRTWNSNDTAHFEFKMGRAEITFWILNGVKATFSHLPKSFYLLDDSQRYALGFDKISLDLSIGSTVDLDKWAPPSSTKLKPLRDTAGGSCVIG